MSDTVTLHRQNRRLAGKAALVTGAGSPKGIGRATAIALADAGAAVTCFDIDGAGAKRTAKLIASRGGRAIGLGGDAARAADVRRAVITTTKAFGRIDVLVNNAAIATLKPIIAVTDPEWARMVAVNLTGYFLFCREAARWMIAHRKRGCIINVSSISATVAGERKVAYCATKGGIPVLTRGLALELGRHGIRVNSVSPGAIATNIVKDRRLKAALARVPVTERTALGRIGEGDDVAGAVAFLASPEAAFITGADLLVDGGLTAGQRLPRGFK